MGLDERGAWASRQYGSASLKPRKPVTCRGTCAEAAHPISPDCQIVSIMSWGSWAVLVLLGASSVVSDRLSPPPLITAARRAVRVKHRNLFCLLPWPASWAPILAVTFTRYPQYHYTKQAPKFSRPPTSHLTSRSRSRSQPCLHT